MAASFAAAKFCYFPHLANRVWVWKVPEASEPCG